MNEEMLDKVVNAIESLIETKIKYGIDDCSVADKKLLRDALVNLFDNSQTETIETTAKEIRHEGYSAGFCNCGGKHNPYPVNSRNYKLWEEGFEQGQYET